MTTQSSKKRSLSPSPVDSTSAATAVQPPSPKRARANNNNNNNDNDLLTELTQVLAEIKSTPSSGEISAELLETFKLLMLQIERLSADETNTEAVQMKHESERCLESWFDDLLARCEADGELDLETLEEQLATGGYDDDDDEDDMDAALSLALALEEEEAEEEEAAAAQEEQVRKRQEHQQHHQQFDDVDDEEEEVVVVDEGAEEGRSPAIQQVIA